MSFNLINQTFLSTCKQHTQRSVLLYLAIRANDEGACWPSRRLISEDLVLDEATVSRALKALSKAGHITISRGPGTGKSKWISNAYKVHPVKGGHVIASPKPCDRQSETAWRCAPLNSKGKTLNKEIPCDDLSSRTETSLWNDRSRYGVGEAPTSRINAAALLRTKTDRIEDDEPMTSHRNETDPQKPLVPQTQNPPLAPAPRWPRLLPVLECPTIERKGLSQPSEAPAKVVTAAPTPKARKTARARNLPLETLLTATGGSPSGATKSEWGRAAKALSEIREVMPDATDEEVAAEITRRAGNYRAAHPTWELTPTALTANWSKVDKVGAPKPASVADKIAAARELAVIQQKLRSMGGSQLDLQNPEFVSRRDTLIARRNQLEAIAAV